MASVSRPPNRDAFLVAILCALPREVRAIVALFDEEWGDAGQAYGKASSDDNSYSFGLFGRKQVGLAHASMGKVAAANVSDHHLGSEAHIQIDREKIKQDLEVFIEKEVDVIVQKRAWSPSTRVSTKSQLQHKHGGTFLWVALVLKNIAQPKVREHEVVEVLQRFPSSLTDVYIRILREVNDMEREYAP